jgi:hypothetical protein
MLLNVLNAYVAMNLSENAGKNVRGDIKLHQLTLKVILGMCYHTGRTCGVYYLI